MTTAPHMNRRNFVRLAGMGAAAAAAAPSILNSATLKSTATKPNVLFIGVDDLRPELGSYGQTQILSPNIDALANEGLRFSRTYCQVPHCAPSRASLLVGVRPSDSGRFSSDTDPDRDLAGKTGLGGHFKNNGYYTISRGKIYHSASDKPEDWSETANRVGPAISGATRNKWWTITEQEFVSAGNHGPAFESADVADNAYGDGNLADVAIADLNRLNNMSSPFFLAVGFQKPHLPFCAPKKYWDLYNHSDIDLANNPFAPKGCPTAGLHKSEELRAYSNIPSDTSDFSFDDEGYWLSPEPLSDDLSRDLIHGYYACVSYVDAQVGKLISELKRLDIYDNTIIVLWGDHGWNLGEHGLWAKHANFETSLHAPLIINAPGYRNSRTSSALTEFVDIYPTLCELCNIGVPSTHTLDGTSLVPLMDDPNKQWKTSVFSRFGSYTVAGAFGNSIKTDRYRYTEWRYMEGDQKDEIYARMLYDHQADPGENVNISEVPEVQGLIAELRPLLLAQDCWTRTSVAPRYYQRSGPHVAAGTAQIQKLYNAFGQQIQRNTRSNSAILLQQAKKTLHIR